MPGQHSGQPAAGAARQREVSTIWNVNPVCFYLESILHDDERLGALPGDLLDDRLGEEALQPLLVLLARGRAPHRHEGVQRDVLRRHDHRLGNECSHTLLF